MARTINNPLSWIGRMFDRGSRHISSGTSQIGGKDTAPINIRDLTFSDLRAALSKGVEDFMAFRSDVIFIVVIYPVVGLLMTWFALHRDMLPLVFPIIAGFALLGPVAAVGLYEMSRRREKDEEASWLSAIGILESPSLFPIVVLGGYLFGIFVVWMFCANLIYNLTLGPLPPVSIAAFLADIFTTGAGWAMLLSGISVGFVFAVAVLAISFVSFPLLVDRNVGLVRAVVTSVRIALSNPAVAGAWGAIVVVLLGLGMATVFIGLIFVFPVLGHASWHLYRHAVERPEGRP